MSEAAAAPKRFLVSWDQFHRDSKALAWRLVEKAESWKGIIAITRGGLIPAGIIARELEIKMVETIGISSYDDQTQHHVKVIKGIETKLVGNGEGWLVIDDLVDTGGTARVVRGLLPKAYFVTLYAKPAGRDVVDLFIKEFKQNKWIHLPWDIEYKFATPIKHGGQARSGPD